MPPSEEDVCSRDTEPSGTVPEPHSHIAVDEDETDELDTESLSSGASTSITSSIRNYRYENGRRYHAYRDGAYPIPNDEKEQDRLDLFHHIWRLINGGSLHRSPIGNDPQRILDIGTGTGIWAIEMADEFPSAFILGNDLSPIQPGWVLPNCKFYIDDAEAEWSYTPDEAFDFVHARGLAGGIGNWDRLYKQIFQHTRPGGWLEVQEFEGLVSSDDDSMDRAHAVREWQIKIDEASVKFGKQVNVLTKHKEKLISAGFVNVKNDTFKVPIGTWPKDKRLKEIGRYQLAQALEGIESYTMALFTRVLGMSNEEAHIWVARARNDCKNPAYHLYVNFAFIYGQKPPE